MIADSALFKFKIGQIPFRVANSVNSVPHPTEPVMYSGSYSSILNSGPQQLRIHYSNA